jgi:hypothetical protein
MARILLLLFIASAFNLKAQIEIYEATDPSTILNGTEVVVEGLPSDFATYIDLRVKNISGQSIEVRFRRDRVIANSAQDQICDNDLCYNCADAPSYTTPSSTVLADGIDMIFKPQFVPDGNSFCAIHDYYVIDQLGFKLDSVRLKFRIGGVNCSVGVDEVTEALLNVNLYPNPSNGEVTVSGAKTGSQLKIVDILGQELKTFTLHNKEEKLALGNMPNGVYFCTVILPNGEALPAKKLVLKH